MIKSMSMALASPEHNVRFYRQHLSLVSIIFQVKSLLKMMLIPAVDPLQHTSMYQRAQEGSLGTVIQANISPLFLFVLQIAKTVTGKVGWAM